MNHKKLLCLSALFALLLASGSAFAVSTQNSSDSEYLYNSGYSKETIRIIEDQKDLVQSRPIKPVSRFNRYIKGLFYEPDYTEHSELFGRRKIMSK